MMGLRNDRILKRKQRATKMQQTKAIYKYNSLQFFWHNRRGRNQENNKSKIDNIAKLYLIYS